MTLAIVTGSSAGLGFHTASGLAKLNYDRIVVTSRSLARATQATKKLALLNPRVEYLPAELQLHDLEQVQAFAEWCKATHGNWDLLVNNAGAKIEHPTKLTRQGFEWHYGVNHLAHFALTSWLRPASNSGSRVVVNASIVARKGKSELWRDARMANTSQQYDASKLANLCFALELNSRGYLEATAAHPGFARAEAYGNLGIRIAEYLFAQSARSGAKPIIRACEKDVAAGTYWGPRVLQMWGQPIEVPIPKLASIENRRLLWEVSEQQLGFKF
ncbi:MAG: SDR family NAD(P)-dependent oxidoreductase [Micrococcales bacterium]